MVINGKVILVTGAGHGIGATIAERLAAQGARIAITYRFDKAGADRLVKALREAGVEIRAYRVMELADDKQCEALFRKVIKDFGSIDAVIANASGAGSAVGQENLNDLDLDNWQENLKENLLVAVTTTKHAVKAFNKFDSNGKIVIIGSVLGLDNAGNPKITAYSAGKAATHNFAKTIAKALAPKISVNVVSPGRCWSSAYENLSQADIDAKFAPNRHGRPVEWSEIAQAVNMVLENDSIIGEIVNVDAGFSLLNV